MSMAPPKFCSKNTPGGCGELTLFVFFVFENRRKTCFKFVFAANDLDKGCGRYPTFASTLKPVA